MKIDLASLNNLEIKSFLDSFDTIFCDCDGVLWSITTPIPGIKDTLDKLKELGKEIRFITNNNTYSREDFCKKIKTCYFYVQPEDILFPTIVIINYLKHIQFDKEIFCLAFPAMREELVKAGFKLAQHPLHEIPYDKRCVNYFKDNKAIGAVIIDADLNLNYGSIQNTTIYLQRPEVLFLLGGCGEFIPMTPNLRCPGNWYFKSMIEEFTGRKAMPFGKPSENLKSFITDAYEIKDPSRVLFIGDALEQDMAFAAECGYKKLLVFSGATKPEDVRNCTNKNEIPDYCISSLGDLYKLITNE